MLKLDKYLKIKRKVDSAQQESNKVEGAFGEVMKQLKKEFKCSTIKEAEAELKERKKKRDKVGKKFDSAVEDFEEKWSDELD